MSNEDESLRQKLLNSDTKMDKTVIENEKDGEDGDLRLHDAVCDPDNIEEIETLVSEEPHLVFETDKEKSTPLHTLVLTGDELVVDIAKILLGVVEEDESLISIERPEVLNRQDYRKFTALHYAAQGRQVEVVEALLRWGADPSIQDKNGNTPLHIVAESNTEKAVKVAELLLNQTEGKTLINAVNNSEHTPLHRAIEKRSLNMVNFLLLPHVKCNLSFKAKNSGRSVLHFAASEAGESDTACEVLKSVLLRCTKPQVEMQDSKGKTALHLAAIQRYPKIAKVLVDDERTNVLITDEMDRTALHYAAEDGCYTKGYECVEVLVGRNLKSYSEQVNYLFKMKDKKMQTPFMYACINCPADTMKKFVERVPHPQEWLTSTHMTLLYKNCPLAIPSLMNNAFQEEKVIPEFNGTIRTDFGLITGYVDPLEKLPQQETRYLKEALWWDFRAQREVLLHPLAQFFIAMKWQKLRWIIAVWIIWQLIWLAAYTSLALSFYRATVASPGVALVASLIMIVYLIGSLLNEFFEIFTIGFAYFLSLTNSLQLLQDVLGFIAISPVLLNYEEPLNWMKYTTAVGVLLAYILSMRDIGKLHGKIGLIVEVLKQVLVQIVQVLLCCSPLWIGFTVAFLIIFSDEDSLNSSFPGPIVKVFVMMTGEFEYNDTFNKEANGEAGKDAKEVSATVSSIKLLFFLAFLISVPVGFFNLLTGFALDKVMELRERAKVARIAKQLEHIYFIESILLSLRPLSKILSYKTIIPFLRRFNVTSMWIDGELKFETLCWEKIRKSEGNFQPRGFRGRFFSGKQLGIWRTELPADVQEEIYALASPKSQPE